MRFLPRFFIRLSNLAFREQRNRKLAEGLRLARPGALRAKIWHRDK
jgi:hypothetical protein